MLSEYLECGKVNNTHGIKGLLRVEHFCDSDDVFCSLGRVFTKNSGGYTEYKVRSSAPHGPVILLGLEGIDGIDAAAPFKNRILYARREDLPVAEGDHFIADLIGLPVIDAVNGKVYGTVTYVENHGASDVYEIKSEDGSLHYMPAVPEFVSSIDLEKGVFVTPIEGMF